MTSRRQTYINIVYEDKLSEAVMEQILALASKSFVIHKRFGGAGYGYIKKNIRNFNQAAAKAGIPFFIVTDLDEMPCASAKIDEWLGSKPCANMLFRVAVHEIESWLLADYFNLAAFLGISTQASNINPDDLPDPKQYLIDLASKSTRRSVRDSIVPTVGSTAKQGPDYNGILIKFVRKGWSLENARKKSNSLERTFLRLREFARCER